MQVARAGGPAAEAPVAAGPTAIKDPDGKRLVADCLEGNAVARMRFQAQFGPLIYRSADYAKGQDVEAGDFYVYLFEDDRLYRRLRSYEGRAALGSYLRGCVLPDLFKQFRAMNHRESLTTVHLDVERVAGDGGGLGGAGETALQSPSTEIFEPLEPEQRLLIKLMYVEDFELTPSEVRLLAERSGRSLQQVVRLVEEGRASVQGREVMRHGKLAEAESAGQWILQYERRLARVAEDLKNLPPQSTQAERLRERQAELERKRAWRHQQRQQALGEARRATVTLRYREIAEILNQPVGTVSAKITRLRQDLLARAAQLASERKGTTDEHR